MQLRRATMEDLYDVQQCNLRCLPENYNLRLYYYHILSWPQLLYVQTDYHGRTVGYVLGKIDDEEDASKAHGHITSLAVLRSHRKLGIASRVMRATLREMDSEYAVPYCSLHVRKTNDAALHLYQDTLGFRCANVDAGYYLDGEDAYLMRKYFRADAHGGGGGMYVNEARQLVHKPVHTSATTTDNNSAAAATTTKASNNNNSSSNKATAAAAAARAADGASGKKGSRAADAHERQQALAELLEQLGDDNKSGGGGGGNKGGGGGSSKSAGKRGKK